MHVGFVRAGRNVRVGVGHRVRLAACQHQCFAVAGGPRCGMAHEDLLLEFCAGCTGQARNMRRGARAAEQHLAALQVVAAAAGDKGLDVASVLTYLGVNDVRAAVLCMRGDNAQVLQAGTSGKAQV